MQRALRLIGASAAIVFTRDLSCNTNRFECSVGAETHLWASTLAGREDSEPLGAIFQASGAARAADVLGTLLERSPTLISGLYIRRRGGAGPADIRSRAMLGLLAPHIRQALCIGRRVEGDAPALALRMQQAAGRYGLTPAEVRVVQTLLNGCTIERGARLLGIQPATVKTHLQHVFDKTTARRQVDLIKLIAVPGLIPGPAPVPAYAMVSTTPPSTRSAAPVVAEDSGDAT
jgi:DNA-binding CsgD family transcriptional regulator